MRFCGRCSLFKKILLTSFSCYLVEFRCMLIQWEFNRVYFLVLCWWVNCDYIVVIRFLYYLYVRVCACVYVVGFFFEVVQRFIVCLACFVYSVLLRVLN